MSNEILWTSPSGKWTIESLNERHTHLIVADNTGENAGWNANPILVTGIGHYYPSIPGEVVYDFPERIPKYVKREVERILKSERTTA